MRGAREKILIAIEAFCGLGALAGGVALMVRPDGAVLHMPASYLAGSPFADYLVPGLLLAVFVGAGMLGAALLLIRCWRYGREAAIVPGAALVIFEIVEFSVIGFNPLQVLFGVLGAIACAPAMRRSVADLHPVQHVLR